MTADVEKKENTAREPLFHIVRRDAMKTRYTLMIRAIALLAALIVTALFVFLVTGLNPFKVYATMIKGTFGNGIKIWSTITAVTKLLCIAIALGIAFRMRFWNIGGEGQVLVGALATAMMMVYFGEKVPTPVLFLLMLVTSVLAGAIWGFIPAFFKAKWNTNETLFTLMMNYIAIQLVAYYHNKWMGDRSSLGKINTKSHAGWFPEIKVPLDKVPPQTGVINVIVVLALVVLVYFYLKKTKQGYEIAVVGESQNTARYAGINVKKVILRTVAISGAICGLCGMLNVAGVDQTISINTASGYGFTAIIVAWMANFNTFYMMLISLFIVFLEKGTGQIANTYHQFSTNATQIVVGIILFFMVGCEFFIHYRVLFREKKAGKAEPATELPAEPAATEEAQTAPADEAEGKEGNGVC